MQEKLHAGQYSLFPSSYRCCCITLSNRRPQIAAVVVIDIVAIGSGGGIIAVAVAVAVAISPIAIIAVIVDVASLTSLRHHHQNGGGASFFGTYPTYSYVGYSARPLVVCGNECFTWRNRRLPNPTRINSFSICHSVRE